MSEGNDILYEVRGKVTLITLNNAEKLNSLDNPQCILLAKLVERADKEDTTLTIIQSTGRYFSAGGNLSAKDSKSSDPSVLLSHEYWLEKFVAKNIFLTDLFHNHTKVLVAALNGPAIGVSAALVALCDLIYVMDEKKCLLSFPFSTIGVVAEAASSATLFLRLGWSKSSEALLLGTPISGLELNRLGFINKSYNDIKFDSVEHFNRKVHDDLVGQFSNLYEPSILANKQLLKANRDELINSASSREVIKTFNRFVEGVPQRRFAEMMQKRKNKM